MTQVETFEISLIIESQEYVLNTICVFSPQPGYREVSSVSFIVCPETDLGGSITVTKGSWIVAEVDTFGKDGETIQGQEVALVLAVLQVHYCQPQISVPCPYHFVCMSLWK